MARFGSLALRVGTDRVGERCEMRGGTRPFERISPMFFFYSLGAGGCDDGACGRATTRRGFSCVCVVVRCGGAGRTPDAARKRLPICAFRCARLQLKRTVWLGWVFTAQVPVPPSCSRRRPVLFCLLHFHQLHVPPVGVHSRMGLSKRDTSWLATTQIWSCCHFDSCGSLRLLEHKR
jgi:hypothetical protein